MISRDAFMKALGQPDPGFDRAVDAALRSVMDKEDVPIMKKKLTLTLLAAVLAVLALTGAALAIGLNLFEYFGDTDPRLKAVAPEPTVAMESPGDIATDAVGITRVRIGNAYYDGQSLIVAYTMKDFQRCDSYVPTEMELKAMAVSDAPFPATLEESEQPAGSVVYRILPAEGWYADDGTPLPVYAETIEQDDDGMMICLREFQTPLPEAARDREGLTLRVPMKLSTTWRYFDGQKCYERHAEAPVTELTFTVSRTDAVTRVFTGSGKMNDMSVKVEAQVSAVHVKLRIHGMSLSDDSRYDCVLRDSMGMAYRLCSCVTDADVIDLEYDGLGYIPDELTLTVSVDGGDDRGAEARVLPGCPIILKPE